MRGINLAALACASAILACASAPIAPAPLASPDVPSWTLQKSGVQPGVRLFTGYAPVVARTANAEAAAMVNALAEAARSCRVAVDATLEIVEEDSTESGPRFAIRSSARLVTGPVVFRDFSVVERHQVVGTSPGVFVRVAVPDGEMARIRRALEGMTALAVTCAPSDLCPSDLRDRIVAIAAGRGLKIASADLPAMPRDATVVRAEAARLDVAYLLEARVEIDRQSRDGDEHYAWVRLAWRLVSGDTGETVRALAVAPVKGGHYSPRDAYGAAVKKLLDRLAMDLEAAP